MELLQRLSPRSHKARKGFYYFDMARSGSTCLKFKTLRPGHDTTANNISNLLLPTSRVVCFVRLFIKQRMIKSALTSKESGITVTSNLM